MLCMQAKNTRMSDMTIADFWGIEEIAPEMDDGKGTSLIITRTNKGQNLFDSIEMGSSMERGQL